MRGALWLSLGFFLLGALGGAAYGAADKGQAVVAIFVFGEAGAWVGSGFVIGDGSWVVTAADLLTEPFTSAAKVVVKRPVVVSPFDGEFYRAQTIATDEERNLALLRLPSRVLPAAALARTETFQKRNLRVVAERMLLSGEDQTARWPTVIYGLLRSEKNPSNIETQEWRAEKAVLSERSGVKWLYLARLTPEDMVPKGCPVERLGEGVAAMYQNKIDVGLIGGGGERKLLLSQCLPVFEMVPFLTKSGLSEEELYAGWDRQGERPKSATEAFQLVYRALSFVKNGNWTKAEESAKALVDLRPQSTGAHMLLGVALAGLEKNEEALKALSRAAELDPKLPDLDLNRGEVLFALDKDQDAEQAYRRSIEQSPSDVRPLLRLSKLLSNHPSRRAEAVELARKAVSIEPSSPGAHLALGLRLKESGEIDASITELKRTLSLAPTWAAARTALADNYRSQGKMSEAEEQYRTIVEDHPRSAAAQFDLASFLAEVGKTDEARNILEELQKLNPPKELEEPLRKLREKLAK